MAGIKLMGARIIPLPLQNASPFFLHKCSLSSSQVISEARVFVGREGLQCYKPWHCVAGDPKSRNVITVNGLPSSSQFSSQEGDAEDQQKCSDDGAMAAGGVMKDEEKSDMEMSSSAPHKSLNEGLNELNKDVKLQIKENSNGMNPPMGHSRSEMCAQDNEVRAPSWAVPVLTFVAGFSAGVALALFRGGLLVRNNQEAMVDVWSTPSAATMATVPYPEQLLGHFQAEEAPESDLKAVLADRSVKLRTAAADAFLRMQGAARKDGIWLTPLSGFRSIMLQQGVFFDIKAERLQPAPERAKVSAPPGYSEHHTGYAIDIGDVADPDTHLNQEFDQTAAYSWLQSNAARSHFEISFPKDNIQGIMYEPWHWRFVGDDHSLHTFYAQHKLYGRFTTCNP